MSQYDHYLRGFQQAAIQTERLAATLNAGQAFVLSVGARGPPPTQHPTRGPPPGRSVAQRAALVCCSRLVRGGRQALLGESEVGARSPDPCPSLLCH